MPEGLSFCQECNEWTKDYITKNDVCYYCGKEKHNVWMEDKK